MLEQLLANHFVKDLGNYGLSKLANGASLYLDVSKRGVDVIADLEDKEDVKRDGLGSFVFDKTFMSLLKGVCVGGILYAVDGAYGIQNDVVNFHHAFIYGITLANWVSAGRNVARAFGKKKSAEAVDIESQLDPEKLKQPLDLEILRGLEDYSSRVDEGRLVGALRRFRDASKRGEITDEEVIKLYKAASENPVLRARYFSKVEQYNLLEQYLLVKDLIKQPSLPKALKVIDRLDGKEDGDMKVIAWLKKLAF